MMVINVVQMIIRLKNYVEGAKCFKFLSFIAIHFSIIVVYEALVIDFITVFGLFRK